MNKQLLVKAIKKVRQKIIVRPKAFNVNEGINH